MSTTSMMKVTIFAIMIICKEELHLFEIHTSMNQLSYHLDQIIRAQSLAVSAVQNKGVSLRTNNNDNTPLLYFTGDSYHRTYSRTICFE